jgi:predicted transport protein
MSDIRLFRLDQGQATAIEGTASHLEKPLQTLIETNLEPLLGIRFVASEYSTGKTHAGRIDTLGLDENHCPVILEYKRSTGENVINQGLFYLDWLMDHQAEFKPPTVAEIFDELETYLHSLGDDVQRKDLKLYVAFKRLRNFATVVFQNKALRLFLNLNPDQHPHVEGLTRDVRRIGHWGTGDLELLIHSLADLERAKPYLIAAYGGEQT